jgi:hypothetical protein
MGFWEEDILRISMSCIGTIGVYQYRLLLAVELFSLHAPKDGDEGAHRASKQY